MGEYTRVSWVYTRVRFGWYDIDTVCYDMYTGTDSV